MPSDCEHTCHGCRVEGPALRIVKLDRGLRVPLERIGTKQQTALPTHDARHGARRRDEKDAAADYAKDDFRDPAFYDTLMVGTALLDQVRKEFEVKAPRN